VSTTLVWTGRRAAIDCPVCRFRGDGIEELTLSGASPTTLEVVRCPECSSVVITGEMFDIDISDATVDGYVENGAGIEAIARNLYYLDPATVHNFLDVGSNYGFGAHLARHLLGWEVVGIEPGTAGRRGARELDLPIRDEFLLENTTFEREFDLVLASEVLEHIPEPAGFLKAIAAHVAPGGHLVLTTPAAEIIDAREDENEIVIAVSPGYHVFLASAAGLERLLREAGFGSVLVVRDHRTLRAVAAIEPNRPLVLGDYGPSTSSIEAYYDRLATDAPAGSALSSGMASRHFRALVNRGAFDSAVVGFRRAAEAIRMRHGVDVADPAAALEALRSGTAVPWNLIPVAYSAGMLNLLALDDYDTAVAFFDLTIAAAELWREQALVLDGDSADLAVNAARHRALALTRSKPERVRDAVDLLRHWDTPQSAAVWTARLFTDLVQLGTEPEAAGLRPAVELFVSETIAGVLTADATELTTAIRAALSLALVDLHAGSSGSARTWLAAALAGIDAYRTGDAHPLGQEVTHYAQEVVAPILSRELWGLYREELTKGDYAEARGIAGALGQVARLQDVAVARERARSAVARFPRLMRALLALRGAARPGRS
jgi:SAM-dependent methyltransferase